MKIPFGWLPAAWGLSGRPRQEAEANYYLSGRKLEERLIEIRYDDEPLLRDEKLLNLSYKHGDISEFERDVQLLILRDNHNPKSLLELDYRHGKIDPYSFDTQMVELNHPKDNVDKKLALLDVEYTHGKIEEQEYEKTKATLKDEPWVRIVKDGINMDEGVNSGFFEFDWNEMFIDYLRLNGYGGETEEDLVERWFVDICRSQVASSNVYVLNESII